MRKEAKVKLLGTVLLLIGFLLLTLYPYIMYYRGEETSFEVIRATLTLMVAIIAVAAASLGASLLKGD
ncbi:MAG: hypothetical protein LRS47_03860 [Desulfurococcales archaeon]|nr:hypothetical protein [Desulfurococcales archaeon]